MHPSAPPPGLGPVPPPHPPPGEGLSVEIFGLHPLTLILLGVLAWVAFRVLGARRRGEPAARAAGVALAQAAPPAALAGTGVVILGLALVVLGMVLVMVLIEFVVELPFQIFAGLLAGEPAPPDAGERLDEVSTAVTVLVVAGGACLLGAVGWICAGALRAARAAGRPQRSP